MVFLPTYRRVCRGDPCGRPPYTGVQALSSIRLYCSNALRFCDPHSFFSALSKRKNAPRRCKKEKTLSGDFSSSRTPYRSPGRNHRLLPALATNAPPARLLNVSRPDRRRQGSFAPSPRPLSVGFADISPPRGESSSSPTAPRFTGLAAGPLLPSPTPPPKLLGSCLNTWGTAGR